MDSPQQPKRPARRRADAAPTKTKQHGKRRALTFDEETYQMVLRSSKGFKISMAAYSAAAIKYFAEKGLDPTMVQGVGMAEMTDKLAHLSIQVGTMQETARKQSADIGNRVVGMWRTLEKNLYGHLASEQMALLSYLEMIETNLLEKAAATESQYLWPMMERVIRMVAELMITRQISSDIMEKQVDRTITDSKQREANSFHEQQIQTSVVQISRKLLEGVKLAERNKSQRPTLTAQPNSALPPPKVPTPPIIPPAQP